MALALALLAVASASNTALIGVMTKNFDADQAPDLQLLSGIGAPTQVKEMANVGGILPGCIVHLPQQDAVILCSLGETLGGLISVVSTKTGELLNHWGYDKILVDNIAHDESTNTTWINGFDEDKQLNSIYKLELDGTLTSTVELPKMIVETGRSAYCQKGHVFFLTLRDDDVESGIALIRVDMQAKKLIGAKVPLQDDLTIIMWDSTTATMYAWFATETAPGMTFYHSAVFFVSLVSLVSCAFMVNLVALSPTNAMCTTHHHLTSNTIIVCSHPCLLPHHHPSSWHLTSLSHALPPPPPPLLLPPPPPPPSPPTPLLPIRISLR
jgi:hypothetical protein